MAVATDTYFASSNRQTHGQHLSPRIQQCLANAVRWRSLANAVRWRRQAPAVVLMLTGGLLILTGGLLMLTGLTNAVSRQPLAVVLN